MDEQKKAFFLHNTKRYTKTSYTMKTNCKIIALIQQFEAKRKKKKIYIKLLLHLVPYF